MDQGSDQGFVPVDPWTPDCHGGIQAQGKALEASLGSEQQRPAQDACLKMENNPTMLENGVGGEGAKHNEQQRDQHPQNFQGAEAREEGQQQQQQQQQAPGVSSLITSAPRQQRSQGALLRSALHQQQQLQPQQHPQAEAQPTKVEDDQDLDDLPRRPTQAALGGSVVPPQIVSSSSCRLRQPSSSAQPAGPDSASACHVSAPSHPPELQQEQQHQPHLPLPSFFTTTLLVTPASLPPLSPHTTQAPYEYSPSHHHREHHQPQQQLWTSTGAACVSPFGSPQQQQQPQPHAQQDEAQDSGAPAGAAQQEQQLQGEGHSGGSLQLGRRTTAPEAVEHDLAPQAAADATDVDEDEYMDFDPLQFIKNLPPLDQVVSPFRSYLLPRKTRQCRRKTIVLDLDETLVHSSLEAPAEACDFSFPVFFNNQEHMINVRCRPHLQPFMQRVAELFEVVVFTASQKIYAERLLNILDPMRKLIKHRIYRDACVVVEGNYLKDLSVLGRDLKDTFIIDNSPQAFGFQVDNGIPIESWYNDEGDEELLRMLPFLETLAEAEDVRPVISERFRMRELIENAPSG